MSDTTAPTAEALAAGRRVAWTLMGIAHSVETAIGWHYAGSQLAKERGIWTDKMADQYAGIEQALKEIGEGESTAKACLEMVEGDKARVLAAIDRSEENAKATGYWTEQFGHHMRAQRWAVERA